MMNLTAKVSLLGDSARYDICAACGTRSSRVRDDIDRWIYPAALPDGRRVMLLKVLLTNACERDCAYCGNRASRDVPRTSFTPDELAATFDELLRRRLATGLFLSSAVSGSADRAMERMIAAVEIVRYRYQFQGYVHLKILPGVGRAAVERATQLAQRVSVNLEAPNAERLARLSTSKDFERDLLQRMRWAQQAMAAQGATKASQTTQFVVGVADETDREILLTASQLYRELGLARVYFSAFQPVPATPLEGRPPTPTIREHRLYQCDFLLRWYGFGYEELVFDPAGNLPRSADPKLIWAQSHPEWFPVEVNRADREALLRVPGIGPRSATRILASRRRVTFRDLRALKRLGVAIQRAAPYILLGGRRPAAQLPLWPSDEL
jgi:putative DNA modification/repair radical SAM protein